MTLARIAPVALVVAAALAPPAFAGHRDCGNLDSHNMGLGAQDLSCAKARAVVRAWNKRVGSHPKASVSVTVTGVRYRCTRRAGRIQRTTCVHDRSGVAWLSGPF